MHFVQHKHTENMTISLKGKEFSAQALYRRIDFQKGEAPRYLDNRQVKVVRLSSLKSGRLYPQEIYLILISVRDCVDPIARVRPEGLCQ
jgi:hypothetical protein